ncbi:unnamed protein product [Psylliodes chrysocephalus]|uniref:FAD dependent oxidoreductase domain-containing protein n=1 Tax=Psylliodes chrysocephalus TaxID=3402493 RepID=A0A9P0CXH2_9CUCU|nr:unnamed protein product [Psylliodes chrysocephala]
MAEVAIVGCGIIGMTTAMCLQERYPTLRLTIFAKETSPNTTSDVAAGFWEPFIVGNTSEEKIKLWSGTTYKQLLKWWREGKAKEYGICLLPALFFTEETEFRLPAWLDETLGYQKLSQSTLNDMSQKYNLKLNNGFTFISFTWEASIALPYFQQKFTENGGKIVIREINSLDDLSSFDVVVNCTGLGSRNFVSDSSVEPVRGQIEKVQAPWQFLIKIINSDEKLGYIIPNTNECTLGGTAIKTFDKSFNETQKETIKRNCIEMSPSLSSAKTLRHLVGLRPARKEVRLKIETIINGREKTIKVIHNYGHGGAGVTLSLGCAKEVADLLNVVLNRHKL